MSVTQGFTPFQKQPGYGNLLDPLGFFTGNQPINATYPTAPTFDATGAETDLTNTQAPTLNTQPLNNLENFSTSGNNNPWVQAQQQALQQQTGQAMGTAANTAGAAGTQAADVAGSRGGLTSGQLANLASQTNNNENLARQGVVGQNLQQQGQIGTQNTQNQLGVAENLPGQEVQATQPGIQETGLGLQEQNLENQFNSQNFGIQAGEAAGNQASAVQQQSGGGGGNILGALGSFLAGGGKIGKKHSSPWKQMHGHYDAGGMPGGAAASPWAHLAQLKAPNIKVTSIHIHHAPGAKEFASMNPERGTMPYNQDTAPNIWSHLSALKGV